MRVSAVKNLNLSKAKKQSAPCFSGSAQPKVSSDAQNSEAKKVNYIPRMLLTIGIGIGILLGTNKVFKTKTAPFSYLWK